MAIPLATFTAKDSGIAELAKSEGVEAEILRRCQLVQRHARSAATGADPNDIIVATAVVGKRRIHGSVLWRGGLQQELASRALSSALDAARD